MAAFTELLSDISSWVWGPYMLTLLVGTGIYLTFRMKFLQIRKLPYALSLVFKKPDKEDQGEGDITPFQALMTALAATIGTGNIAGVATAIAAGGPGAVFWMWITALFGMATKYAEAILAVKYRIKDEKGEISGGPMYYISRGLGWKWLGTLFAVFASVAAFGIGNTVQSNSVADAIKTSFGIDPRITGIILAALVAMVILGGIKSIARVTSWLVPLMAVFYILGGLLIIIINFSEIPRALGMIVGQAFTGTAAAGGFAGSGVLLAIRMGVARGVFSNEAGLGSAPIAAAAAKTDFPGRQALVSMTGTFIDTLVVCTITALAIISSGMWNSGETGAALTVISFREGLPGPGGLIVSLGIVFFAFSTILGWAYYGEKSFEYLFGFKSIKWYRYAWIVAVFLGTSINLSLVWSVADIMNALMAIPNLIGLLGLSGVVVAETHRFLTESELGKKVRRS
ncbi:sodium:alanine symporter family protein [Metallumcola ferriviriculae]|uniref:Sodium:alanine symporter family protein n=1 Tax=Metallumcola ferriviriculae TaxID=3039180 RepID=A0AAU0UPL9_9FIRM|nr:sodium:alanine symporter family protein [Desulfitibacteraceae bacterium MK1]